jgi:hypothetical protein
MGTPTGYARRVAKPPWTPTPQQAKLWAAYKRALRAREDAEATYRKILAECDAAGIPIAHLADEAKVQRKTIYRHLGRTMA